MSWKDTLLDASFKGMAFDCESTEDGAERDVAQYAYPYVDGADTDDFGRTAHEMDIVAVFFGDDYETRLQAFLEVLDQPGPGELIHPIFGSYERAQLLRQRVSHSADDVDKAIVRMSFIDSTPSNPFFTRQLPEQSADSISLFAQTVRDSGVGQFTSFMDRLKLAPGALGRLNAVRDIVGTVFGSIHGVVSSWLSAGLDVVNFPSSFSSDLAAGLHGLIDLRPLQGDGLMSNWKGLVSDLDDVVLLPKGSVSGNLPGRFSGAAAPVSSSEGGSPGGGSPGGAVASAQPIPAQPEDVAALDATVKTVVATELADQAAAILADQAKSPTLSPADIEQIANDARDAIQTAIEANRDTFTVDQSRPVTEPLKDLAAAVQQAAIAVIDTRPPLSVRTVDAPANLRLLAFRWYGDHSRATELARLNPKLRNPNDIRAGDRLYGFAS